MIVQLENKRNDNQNKKILDLHLTQMRLSQFSLNAVGQLVDQFSHLISLEILVQKETNPSLLDEFDKTLKSQLRTDLLTQSLCGFRESRIIFSQNLSVRLQQHALCVDNTGL